MSAQDDLSLEDVISDPDALKEKIRAARGSAKHSTNAWNIEQGGCAVSDKSWGQKSHPSTFVDVFTLRMEIVV